MEFPYLRPLPPALPHFVVTNIPVLVTNDPDRSRMGVVRNGYVEVIDGRFGRIGRMSRMPADLETALRERRAKEVSGEGRIVSPGLMQGHTHLCQTLWRGQGEGKQLLEWLRDHTWPGEAALTAEDIAMAAHLAAAEVLSYGATTCLDMGTVHHTLAYVQEGILKTGLRVFTGNVVMDYMDPQVPFPRRLHEDPRAAIRKTERIMKELARLSRETNKRINPAVTMRFLVTSEEQTARELAAMAAENEWVLQTHASESPGEVAAIRARFKMDNIAKLHELGFLGPRTFLHHVVHARRREMRMMARTGTTGVICPGSNGMLGSGVAPVVELLERGVALAIGSDGAPCNDQLSVRNEMWALKVLAGAVGEDSTALSPTQILEMATTGGARGLGMEGEIGRIAPGYRADIVFWDQNSWGNFIDLRQPRDVIGRLVRTTDRATDLFVDGQQVVAGGQPLFIGDLSLFRDRINRAARILAHRAKRHRVRIPLLES